jgi:GAF domain-containing protein
MLDFISRLLPPVSKDPEEARQESLLYLVIGGLAIPGFLFGVVSGINAMLTNGPMEGFIAGMIVQPVYLLAIIIARRGNPKLAAYFPVTIVFLVMIYGTITVGTGHVTYIGYAMATIAASILIGTNAGIVYAFLSMAAHVIVGLLQQQAVLGPTNPQLPLDTLWFDAAGLGFGLAVLVSFSAVYNREIRVSLHMERQLAEALQNEHTALTRRITENKAMLDQRQTQLRTLAETSMAAGAERKPLILLQSAVEMLHHRTNLSLAVVFLLEDPGPQLVLRAASTEAAQRLVNQSYRIPLDSSTSAAKVVASKRLISEVNLPVDLEHPDALSTGHSELAIPMLVGENCLGVLILQSENPNGFDDSDSLAMRGVAQSLAHGLELARLSAQTQADQEEIRALNRRYMAKAWSDMDQMTSDLSISVESGGALGGEIITPLGPYTADAAVPGSITRSADGSQVIAPLILREQVIGALTLDIGEKELSPDDLTFIEAVTTQAALALENARLYSELSRRATYLQTANEIARDASTSLDLDLLLRGVVNLVRERFGFSHAAVYLMDESEQQAVIQAATGDAGQELLTKRKSFTAGAGSVIGHALESGNLYAANNIAQDPFYQPDPLLPDTRSELAVPLRVAGRIIGVLDLHAANPNAFGEDEIAILQTLSGQVAVAVQNARLFSQTSQRAERERKVVEITSHIRSTNDVSSILRTAVSELRRALGISNGVVMVGPMRPAKIEETNEGIPVNP